MEAGNPCISLTPLTMAHRNWTSPEVAATVRIYLDMLELEIAGVGFNKAQRNRELRALLQDRTAGSVERKHQNISAILVELGLPYVDGYKPLGNYQALLAEELDTQLDIRADLRANLEQLVSREEVPEARLVPPTFDEIVRRLVDPPVRPKSTRARKVREPRGRYANVRKVDYLQMEAENRSLGLAGEQFVINFETARLSLIGREDLAGQIEHTSVERGDGTGFDILSFDPDGAERLIEVKTTRFGGHIPFYVTRNEVRVSKEERDRYHLYRVFRFREEPELFMLAGALDEVCDLEATQFWGRVG